MDNRLFFRAGSNPFLYGTVAMISGTIENFKPRANGSNAFSARTDEELLLDYRSRLDRAVFEELVRRYEKELYGYLSHYLGSPEMAEDVFQQTFLQVHLKCDQFEEGRKVRPWLYTVATNQAIDYQRRNRRHRITSLDRRLERGMEGETGTLIDLLDGEEAEPSEEAETTEQCDQLRRAIEQLPEQIRQVVLLVYFQGLKYREAAESMGIPVGTVKSRLHAGVQKLSELLKHINLPK
jgi:RNA polymerase sigma-70 factor (ECF subfamily)